MIWLSIFAAVATLTLHVRSEKVIRVGPRIESHLDFLRGLEERTDIKVDFWKGPSRLFQPVDIEVSDDDFEALTNLLKEHGIDFKIQISDVRKLLENEVSSANARYGGSWHERYHNLFEIVAKLKEVRSNYGNMVELISVGRSYERKEMMALKIKGKSQSNKPVFFIECGIHAREWVSPATCMYMIDEMTKNYNKDRTVTAMLDKIDFVVLPVVNVDGYAYTWINPEERRYRLWRKNRRPSSNGCYGVDLNRNWDHKWGGPGTSSNTCSEVYRGTEAFSEVETRNIRNYLKNLGSRLKGFIDFHAYSQMWFTPWGYTSLPTLHHYEQAKQEIPSGQDWIIQSEFRLGLILPAICYRGSEWGVRISNRVAGIASRALGRVYGTNFQYGSSAALLYPAAGGSEDWTYGKLHVIYSFSVELRDTGIYGFLLPAKEIIPTGRETFEGLKALVREMKI